MPSDRAKLKQHGVTFAITGDCWNCTSHKPNNSGYPMRHGGTLNRFVYRWLIGEIPEGKYVLHTCDNRLCINPKHFWIGTHLDNQKDKIKKGRQAITSGELNGRAKLTAAQVIEIRSITDKQLKEIAKEYGMSFQMISRIRRKEAWHAVEI